MGEYAKCLPSSIHCDDEPHHDAFFVKARLEEVDYNIEMVEKLFFFTRKEEPPKANRDSRARHIEYLDSKTSVVAERLKYATPSRSSWRLKQRAMGDLPQLKEDRSGER